jgi:predicted nucleotidyltransferase component of viral defense system
VIPMMNIVAWSNVVPWVDLRQVEQDLVISRAIVELFSDSFLASQLRFRGGTALNKLHFPVPMRYSEDIDLVRTSSGPIGPILNQVRKVLEPWLGRAGFDQSRVAPKLRFKVQAEDPNSTAAIRLKVEINTSETEAYDSPESVSFEVSNPWFSAAAGVSTFSREEVLATKLRALLQRNKGRDLLDLADAIDVFPNLDRARLVGNFGRYLRKSGISISRAEAERRMFGKLRNPRFLKDVRPLLSAERAAKLTDTAAKEAFRKVYFALIVKTPGTPWAKSDEMMGRFGILPP